MVGAVAIRTLFAAAADPDHSRGAESLCASARKRRWYSVPSVTWLDVQHRYWAIAQRALQRPALHAVAVTAATGRTRPRPTTLRRGSAGAAGAVAAVPAAAQGRGGRDPVRPWCTRLPRCGHSRRSAAASRTERPCPTLGTSFSVMHGTTGEGLPRSFTICSRHAVFRSDSARRTSSSARRCSAKLTRDWRNRESESCW